MTEAYLYSLSVSCSSYPTRCCLGLQNRKLGKAVTPCRGLFCNVPFSVARWLSFLSIGAAPLYPLYCILNFLLASTRTTSVMHPWQDDVNRKIKECETAGGLSSHRGTVSYQASRVELRHAGEHLLCWYRRSAFPNSAGWPEISCCQAREAIT